ncbi:hypothetical protein [Streptodolium elevatio]
MKTQQMLDKRVRPQVAKARSAVVHKVVHPVAGEGRGRVLHASVLDGHSLNLQAVLPLREEMAADAASLFLVRGSSHHRVPLRLKQISPDEVQVAATTLLGPQADGVDLSAGRWRALVLVTAKGQRLRAFDLEGPLGPTVAGGPTQTPLASGLTGRRNQIRLSPLGLLRIAVADPEPRAEMVRFELRHGGARLTFRAVGLTRARPTAVEFTHDGVTRTATPEPGTSHLVTIEVPFDALISGAGAGERVWQLHARLRDGKRVLLTRELDIVRMPRRIFRMRKLLVATKGGALVRVRPHYSSRHQFRIGCTLVAAARPGAPS